MVLPIAPIKSLFEIDETPAMKAERPLSTLAFDSLYVILCLLFSVGIMMDVWSHVEYGPDQSLFNEYHLLFYGAMTAIMALLAGLAFSNLRSGYPLAISLPQGYGLGMLATLFFGFAGGVDLTTHALFGFESDIEALTSPSHLLMMGGWFMILYAPVRAARARQTALGKTDSLLQSVPRLVAYGCMMFSVYVPLLVFLPMGGQNPRMLEEFRPNDDFYGLAIGIMGTILQTAIVTGFALWLAREFKLKFGSYVIAFGFFGLFLTMLEAWQMPWLMFGGFGLLLDIAYLLIKPDATRRARFIAFTLVIPVAMWSMFYGTMTWIFGGIEVFYYTGYNLFGSIGQATALALLLGYLMSMPGARNVVEGELEVAHV